MNNDHEVLVRKLWQQIWIEGATETLHEVLTDPYVRHTRDGTLTQSPIEYGRHIESAVRMIKGTDVHIDATASEDDIVFARMTLHGVNLSTEAPVKITWLTQYRISDGRIAESWTMHQSGLDW